MSLFSGRAGPPTARVEETRSALRWSRPHVSDDFGEPRNMNEHVNAAHTTKVRRPSGKQPRQKHTEMPAAQRTPPTACPVSPEQRLAAARLPLAAQGFGLEAERCGNSTAFVIRAPGNAQVLRGAVERWAEARQIDSDLPPEGPDPKPAAAFRLGYEPRRFRVLQRRLCRSPYDVTAGPLLLAAAAFDEALFELADEAQPGIEARLRVFAREANEFAAACPDLPVGHRAWWREWISLAGRALPPECRLASLARYGAALGDLAVQLEVMGGGGADGQLRAVVRAVHDVPHEYASRADLTSALRSVSPDEAADQLVRGLEAERSAGRDTRGVLCGLVQGLVREQEDFLGRRRSGGRPAEEDSRGLPAGSWVELPHLGVRFDEANRRVARLDGEPVNFGTREIPWIIMRHLLQQRGDLCLRETLMNAAWGTERGCQQRLHITIFNLKADLDQLGLYAESVRKAGYRLRRLPRGE